MELREAEDELEVTVAALRELGDHVGSVAGQTPAFAEDETLPVQAEKQVELEAQS